MAITVDPGGVPALPERKKCCRSPGLCCRFLRRYPAPRHGQRVEVAAGGALADLRLPGNLCCGHLLALLQQEEDGRQPVGTHPDNTARESGQEVTGFGRRMAT